MRRMVNVLVLVLVLSVVAGLLVVWMSRARDQAARTECRNNLKWIGIGVDAYHVSHRTFPAGTILNEHQPPERRLSWFVGAWSFIGDGQIGLILDKTQAWDVADNRCPRCSLADGNSRREEPVGEWGGWRCPANPATAGPDSPGLTHYVGVAGVGPDVATRPVGYPGTGVFGYDRKTTLADIKDGTATTLLAIETTLDNGPWTAGGRPTVRGLDPARGPYVGPGGQFTANHTLLNVAFADGSVRGLGDKVSPAVLEALATVAGGEEVRQVGED